MPPASGADSRLADLALYGLASYVPGLISLGSVYLFVRLIKPEEFGYFSLWSSVVFVFSAVTSQWLRQSVLRYWKEYEQQSLTSRFWGTTILLTVATCVAQSLFMLIGYPLFARLLPRDLAELYLLGIFATTFLTITTVQLSMWQADFVPTMYAAIRIFTSVIILLASAGLLLAFTGQGALALSSGFVLGTGSAVLVGAAEQQRRYRVSFQRLFELDWQIASRFWTFGLPFAGWFIGTYVLSVSDRFVLGVFTTVSVVGSYSAIYIIISGLTSFLATPIIMAAHPMIVATWTHSSERAYAGALLGQYVRLFLMIAMPTIAVLATTSQLVAQVLLPESYAPDGWVVIVLCVGLFANMFSLLSHKGLEMAEKTQRLLLLVAVSAVANMILNLLLIPLLSARGAAIATTLSYLLYVVLTLWQSRCYLAIQMNWNSYLRIGLASFGAGSLAWVLNFWLVWLPATPRLIVIVAASSVVYGACLLLLQEISTDMLRCKVAAGYGWLRKSFSLLADTKEIS